MTFFLTIFNTITDQIIDLFSRTIIYAYYPTNLQLIYFNKILLIESYLTLWDKSKLHAAYYNNLSQSHNVEYVSIFTNYILFTQQTTVSETTPWSAPADGYIIVVRIDEYR